MRRELGANGVRVRAAQLLGPLESRVMSVVWKAAKPVTVRDVVSALEDRGPAYTTIMTIMSRLAEKGILRRTSAGKSYVYEARFTEEEFLARTAQRSVRKLVDDFGDVALAQFAEELTRADPATLERLRRLRDRS